MIAYKPYSLCPNKHPDMPDGYPWCITFISENDIVEDGFIVLTDEEYSILLNSFDLTTYNEALAKKAISDRIKYYQSVAPDVIVDLYATNTLNGMTREQSDQMFDEMDDVLTRIKEGAFPTAIYRLQNKTPNGIVTQDMINNWLLKIQERMI